MAGTFEPGGRMMQPKEQRFVYVCFPDERFVHEKLGPDGQVVSREVIDRFDLIVMRPGKRAYKVESTDAAEIYEEAG